LITLAAAACLGEARAASQSIRSDELVFETLKVGEVTFTNVHILPQTGRTLVITHAGGMATILRKDLSPEVGAKLGDELTPARGAPHGESAGVTQEEGRGTRSNSEPGSRPRPGRQVASVTVLGCLLLLHLACSECLRRICRKTGSPGGWAVWVPVLQVIRAHQAAQVSPALMLLWPCCSVAPLYLVGRLFTACGKNPWMGVLLALPTWGTFLWFTLGLPEIASQPTLTPPQLSGRLANVILTGGGNIAHGIALLCFPYYALIAYPYLAFTKWDLD
jgi:hypothetical protein